jgi:ribosomal protein S18 acetylase RimI-like enzyme
MKPGEEEQVCHLVRQVFNEFVAPLYTQEGVEEFLRYVDPDLLAKRARTNHFVMLAEEGSNLVGAIEVRDFNHISLFFVASESQRKGIANQLLKEAIEIGRRDEPSLAEVSVHSSPNAIGAYEKLGFHAEGLEKVEHGIRFIPMILRLGHDDVG